MSETCCRLCQVILAVKHSKKLDSDTPIVEKLRPGDLKKVFFSEKSYFTNL